MMLRYKQRAVIGFRAAGKESVINAWKREICALQGFCAAYGGNSLSTFWDKLSVPFSKFKNQFTLEEGTEWLSRNVGNELNYTLRNIPKDRRSHLLRSGSLKSSIKKLAMFIEGLWSTLLVAGRKEPPASFDCGCYMSHDNSQGLYQT